MQSSETLKRRIHTAEDLHSLVRTMKALAAVNVRQLEHAVESLMDYRRTIELGLRVVLRYHHHATIAPQVAATGGLGAIVFGSDQGMCGQLNDQIANFAVTRIKEAGGDVGRLAVLAVGLRAAARLEDTIPSVEALPIASSASGITPRVQDILLHIERWHRERHVNRVIVYYCEHTSRASYRLQTLDLLPIDRRWLESLEGQPWPTRVLPTFTADPSRLFSTLVQQYLFVSLYRACAESLASENASRLAAMRGAERSVGDQISELTRQFHQTRQMAVTEELLEIAAGYEALGETP